ncbi:hypothetical protein [Dactylosporangium sp. NPDC050588]
MELFVQDVREPHEQFDKGPPQDLLVAVKARDQRRHLVSLP